MDKTAAVLVAIAALILGALIGGGLMWISKDKALTKVEAEGVVKDETIERLETDLAAARLANEVAAFQIRLGRITIDASRMNYGTARDNMVVFLGDLDAFAERVKGTEHEAAIAAMLENRDQIVSDLSTGSPAAAEMLQRMVMGPE